MGKGKLFILIVGFLLCAFCYADNCSLCVNDMVGGNVRVVAAKGVQDGAIGAASRSTGNYLIAWESTTGIHTDNQQDQMQIRVLSPNGNPLTPTDTLDSVLQDYTVPLAVAYNSTDHEFLALWQTISNINEPNELVEVKAQVISEDGAHLTPTTLVLRLTGPGRLVMGASVAFNSTAHEFCLMLELYDRGLVAVKAQRLDRTAKPISPAVTLASFHDLFFFSVSLRFAPASDRYLAVWWGRSGSTAHPRFQYLDSSLNRIGKVKSIPTSCDAPYSLNVVQTSSADFVTFTQCGSLEVNEVLGYGSVIKPTYSINGLGANIKTVLANPATKGFTIIYYDPSMTRLDRNYAPTERYVSLSCNGGMRSSLLYNPVAKQYLALWTTYSQPGTATDIAAQRIRLTPLGPGCH